MKYGAHIFLWIERWDNKQLWLFDNSKRLGIDVLEIAVGDDVEFDELRIWKEAQINDIEIVISPGGNWPMDMDISLSDSSLAEKALEWHETWISRGAEAGATAYTGALYGHPGRINKTAPDMDEFNRVCDNMYKIAEFASLQGIKIVLEPMSHFRTHFINTPQMAVDLINNVKHPNLMLLFDTYHLITEIKDFYKGIICTKGKLWGLHACENDRGCPGDGLVPWKDISRGLNDIKFDGYIILETYNSTVRNGEFAYSRGMFHHVCPDGNEFVKKGLQFLNAF